MNTLECIKTRRSIRKYNKTPIGEDVLFRIMEAAIHAPSARNSQNWEFIIVRNETTKKRLAEACYQRGLIEQAPVVVVVCSDNNKLAEYGERGRNLFSIQNTAAAAQNLMLAAWEMGVGSCWIGSFDEVGVANAVILPSHVRPLLIITLGYPAEKPEKPERWDPKEVVRWERYE
jgi:nitroreductase